MRAVDELAGTQLQALSSMMHLSVEEVEKARVPKDAPGSDLLLILIFTTAVSTLDAVRILLEHGYGAQAHGLTRSLYDAEIDVALLAADPDLAHYYAAFEAFDLSNVPGRAIRDGIIDASGPERTEAIADRKDELKAILHEMGHAAPDVWDEMDLLEAAQTFARAVWGKRGPTSWRRETEWETILNIAGPRQFQALNPDVADEDGSADWLDRRKQEHYVAYAEMCARLHCSPRVAAEKWPDFEVGGFPESVPRVAEIAGTHFVRIHHTVFDQLKLTCDLERWAHLMEDARESV